jgi:putative ABC transport system ATP-binding protein
MIHLAGIERTFLVGDEAVNALSNVNFTARQGEYVAIMGPSGSGKSTLLNIIGLLDRPDKGIYTLENLNTTELTDDQRASMRRNKIGFVFQFFHLVPRLTAAENVELPMILADVDSATRKSRVQEALSSLGLSDRTKHRPDQLSGGQRQRVAIARATIMQPDVILADEPTGNLDRTSGIEVIRILEDLNHKGMTLIMVTHDPDLSKRAARRVQLADGNIATDTGGF